MANNFGRVNVSITASTGGLTAGLSNASKQVRGFASKTSGLSGTLSNAAAGFVGLGRGASMAAVGMRALGMAVKTVLAPLLLITGVVSLFSKFGQTAQDLDAASKAASRLGMSMTTFQNLSQVADEAGVGVGQLTTLLTVMNRNLGNLSNGSKSAEKAFAQIGLTFANLQGLAPEQQFELISQRIMALPTAAERTSAAMAVFGRQGAAAMGLISDASRGAVTEVARLREQLGVNLTGEQAKGIEMMNDSLSRVSLVLQGFITQMLAELAPAVATVANLFVQFFAENTAGWSIGKSLGYAFGQMLRALVGYWTALYGIGQIVFSVYAKMIALLLPTIGTISGALGNMTTMLADAAAALGFDDLEQRLRKAGSGFGKFAKTSEKAAGIAAADAAAAWENGWNNISNPFAAFDEEFAKVTAQMNEASAQAGQKLGDNAGASLAAAVGASTEALKAIVVGSSEGEAFRNSIMRGADPRNEVGRDGARTADATERTADATEDLTEMLGGGGLGLASISV